MVADNLAWFTSASTFAVAVTATPGPNNTMVTASGAAFGFRRTLPHMLGISVGFPVMIVAVALGAGAVLTALPWLETAMRIVGALYMLWLAWHIARAEPFAAGDDATVRRRPLTFLQAALFQWVNPKAWIIALGAVVTYTGQGHSVLLKAMILAAIFFVVTVPSTSFWTTVGVGAGRLLRTRTAVRRFNLAMAALLVASLVPLAFE